MNQINAKKSDKPAAVLTLLPVEQWKPGWSAKALRSLRASAGLAETVDGYLSKVFKGWGRKFHFTGKKSPMHGLKPVPGWSDFAEIKGVTP